MKAFIAGLVVAIALAVAAGVGLEGWFSQDAESAFAAPGARVEPEPAAGASHGPS